uniref:Secreted protein n=1 Tax=Cucumis melo TaxID=3656 RepID=A0A9I9E7Q7_CUCME
MVCFIIRISLFLSLFLSQTLPPSSMAAAAAPFVPPNRSLHYLSSKLSRPPQIPKMGEPWPLKHRSQTPPPPF